MNEFSWLKWGEIVLRFRYFCIFALLCSAIMGGCTDQQTVKTSSPSETQNLAPNRKIGIDPGHGWKNAPGAVGNGLQEKDINIVIAVLTKSILESHGFQVIMTRTGDDEHDLNWAAKVINEENPDIVVSIHANSGGSSASGTEACYTVGKNTDIESKVLASLITDSISNKLSLTNRGIFPENSDSRCARKRETGWEKLYIHDMNSPTTLIETAFISNSRDADLLKNRSQDFAQAIADGILTYFQTQNTTPTIPTQLPTSKVTVTRISVPTASPLPTPTSIFQKNSFRLPDDGIRNNNQAIGPFCCTGHTAIVRNNDGEPIGYIYFYGWDGQAYNVGNGRSIAPSIEILISGLADLADVSSPQLESVIFFDAAEMIHGASRSAKAGSLYFTATIQTANLQFRNTRTYFDMGSVVVDVEVSRYEP